MSTSKMIQTLKQSYANLITSPLGGKKEGHDWPFNPMEYRDAGLKP